MNEYDPKIRAFVKILGKHRDCLTKQQIKTLRGQAFSGDIDGALRGLNRLLKKKGVYYVQS